MTEGGAQVAAVNVPFPTRLEQTDAAAVDGGMATQFGVEPRGRTDEHDAEIGAADRVQRTIDDLRRGVVAAHRVNGNPDHQGSGIGWA